MLDKIFNVFRGDQVTISVAGKSHTFHKDTALNVDVTSLIDTKQLALSFDGKTELLKLSSDAAIMVLDKAANQLYVLPHDQATLQEVQLGLKALLETVGMTNVTAIDNVYHSSIENDAKQAVASIADVTLSAESEPVSRVPISQEARQEKAAKGVV